MQPAFADFRLLDAIQEFGERRFIRQRPAQLKAGPVRIYPKLRTKMNYDSNILGEHEDPRGEVVFNIQPGVVLELPIDRHQIVVGYEADFETFTKSRSAKQTDQNQNLLTLIDLRFPSWYVNILEQFSETSGRAGTTFTDRIPRYDNSFNPKIGVRLNRFIFELGFRHYLRDFRRQIDDPLNFQLVEWTFVIFYDLFARLKAFTEAQVSQIDYDDNFQRNGTFTQTRVGIEGEVLPNLLMKARLGVQFRNYEVESKPDFNSWVADFRVKYQVREDLLIRFSAERVPVEATFGNVNFYKRHIMRLGMEYDVTPKWVAFQNFKYYRDSYAERASVFTRSGFRRDNHVRYEIGLRYQPQEWWELEVMYDYLHRNSNFNRFDFSRHRFSLTSTLSY